MKKRYTLDKKLAAYSAAAGVVLAGATDVQAQERNRFTLDRDAVQAAPVITPRSGQRGPIVYGDVNPDRVLESGGIGNPADILNIDFDGDGTIDLTLDQRDRSALGTLRPIVLAFIPNDLSTRGLVAGSVGPYFNYPAALSSGSPVSVSQSFLAGGATGYGFYRNFLLGSTYGTSQYGNWPGETDKFLGVRFVADANAVTKRMTTHFGWVRLDVDAGNRTATVKDFAYAVTPLDPLNTQVILPVELTSFDVSVVDGTPRLAWTTATEDDNAGFEVQARRLDQPDFRTLGFVNGAGTTSEAQSYSFDATDLTPGRYAFRLRQVDFDGAFEFSPVVEATVTVPGTHLLTEAYPNPFNPSARFELSVPTQQEVRVSLHDAQGREVQELFAGRLDADSPQTIRINAVDLPSGVYLYRVVGANFTDAKTVSLVK